MKTEDILSQLDFSKSDIKKLTDDDSKVEDFTDIFNKTFISKVMASKDEDIVDEILGQKIGSFKTKFKREFDLTTDETKDQKLEDIIGLVSEKHKKVIEEKDKEIEGLKDTSTSDEKVDKLQKDFDTLTETKNKFETDLQTSNKDKEELIEKHEKELNHIETKTLFNNFKSEIPFADSVTSLTKTGFFTMINDKYDFKLEEGVLIPLDKKGEKISNEKATGYLNTEEVLLFEGGENKLLKQNDVKPVTTQPQNNNQNNNQGNPDNVDKPRLIHPDMQKHKDKLEESANA